MEKPVSNITFNAEPATAVKVNCILYTTFFGLPRAPAPLLSKNKCHLPDFNIKQLYDTKPIENSRITLFYNLKTICQMQMYAHSACRRMHKMHRDN